MGTNRIILLQGINFLHRYPASL